MLSTDQFQISHSSAKFKRNYSTEIALLKVVMEIRSNLDKNKPSVLVLLNLRAAVDAVDHQIPLNRLSEHVGPVCNCLKLDLLIYLWKEFLCI